MSPPPLTLVCFAVKNEAQRFRRLAAGAAHIRILVTGMGRKNAESAVRSAVAMQRPELVLTCGFAGGLRPGIPQGCVLFATDPESGLAATLLAAGARTARFYCAEKVATSAKEKQALAEATGAEAVEMESQWIRNFCRQEHIASATLRVILDTVEDDLPVDFNQFMTDDMQLDAGKLALALARSPTKIAALLRLQRSSRRASESLALVLRRVLLQG